MHSISFAVAICAGFLLGHVSLSTAAAGSGSCQAEMTPFPLDPASNCCMSAGPTSDVLSQQPWAALIDYELKKGGIRRMCAGTLISARYILTAAHCTVGQVTKIGTPVSVRLGEYDLNNKGKDCVTTDGAGADCNDEPVIIAVEKVIPHPEYNDGASQRNDIALIRLKEAAPYTDFIRPICLPTKNPESNPPVTPMVAVSWFKDQANKDVKILVEAPFVSKEKCQTVYSTKGRNVDLGSGQICAGGLEGKDTCRGDGGGPLVYENQRKAELIGTVSFGPSPCGLKDVPSVYTNVYGYIDWIKSNIVA